MFAKMQTMTPLASGDTSNYGFGVVSARYRGARVVEHNGADAGYRSYAGRFPDQGLEIAVACNAATANTTVLARGVADAFLGGALSPVEAEVTPQATTVSDAQLRRRAGVYLQPTTMQVLELSMRDGRLSVGRQAGPALLPVAENRFRVTGAPIEFVFADGDRAGFERRTPGARPVPFERREPLALTPGALSTYAGEYVSEELGGSIYRVTATDTTISLRTGTSSPIVGRPVFADTFLAGGYTIQFSRTRGAVSGFDVTNGRIRHVKFAKKP
jgi:hypothetical protein